MARLIFESAEILNSSDATQGVISGIVVEGLEQTLTPDTVNLEDNRELYESYTGRIVVRTINTTFDNAGGDILASNYVSTNGTLPTEGKLRLNGKTGSHDITTATTYIMAHNDFSNGRREIVLVAQASDVSGTAALVVGNA
jgi:hypothetical protein